MGGAGSCRAFHGAQGGSDELHELSIRLLELFDHLLVVVLLLRDQ
jgi:hypothetical protein